MTKRPPDLQLPSSRDHTLKCRKISPGFSNDCNVIKEGVLTIDDFEKLDEEKREFLIKFVGETKDEKNKILQRDLFKNILSKTYTRTRDNYYDYLALGECVISITDSCEDFSKCYGKLLWCHKIQNSISNTYTQEGWKVSFSTQEGHDRYYYLNEILQKRKIIQFFKSWD